MHWQKCATDFRLTFSDLEPLEERRYGESVQVQESALGEARVFTLYGGTHVLLSTRHGSEANGE